MFLKNFWGKGGTCLKNELVLGEPGHPYQFLYIEFVVGVSGFRRNQRGKIPEIIPAASTGSGETWVLTIHPIWTGAGSGETRVLTIHPIWAGAGS